MQPAAMETSAVCCVACVRDPPSCPDPFPLWRHTFPGGFHIQHLPCPPTPRPTHSKRASGRAFLNKGRPHTPAERVRGQHPGRGHTIQPEVHSHTTWHRRRFSHLLGNKQKNKYFIGYPRTLHQLLRTLSFFFIFPK